MTEHPRMFDDDEPALQRVREIALALPGAAEKVGHGRPMFFTQKVFCYYGGSLKVDGAWVRHDESVMVMPDPGDAPAMRQDDRFWVPGYLGPSGWLGIDLADLRPGELAELLDASYRVTAPRRLVRELDAR